MKYIKTYKIFENNNSDLISKLEGFDITNYIINDDGSIDVKGDVNLHNEGLREIPFKFGKVSGDFICADNQLTSLKGCPSEVGESFLCYNCKLSSLEFAPLEIGGNFYCSSNKLTMLDCSSYVKGNVLCYNMFEQEPEFFGHCEGRIIWKL